MKEGLQAGRLPRMGQKNKETLICRESEDIPTTLKSCKLNSNRGQNNCNIELLHEMIQKTNNLIIRYDFQEKSVKLTLESSNTWFDIHLLKIRYGRINIFEVKSPESLVNTLNLNGLERHPFESIFTCEVQFVWESREDVYSAVYEFAVPQFQTRKTLKNSMLPHFRPSKTICGIFHQDFEMDVNLNSFEKNLLMEIENYKNMTMYQKLRDNSKLFYMFTQALLIDDLEAGKEFQQYEADNILIEEESGKASYSVPSTAEILRENPENYQIVLIPMDRYSSVFNEEFRCTFANIESYSNGRIYFERKQPLKDFKGRLYHLKFVPNRFSLRACLFAVHKVDHKISKFFRNFQGLEFAITTNRNIQFTGPDFQWKNKNIEGNSEQMQAIKQIVNCSAYPSPYIIFGPPGTGKTSTLVETVVQILLLKPDSHILISAQSNSACDEIITRLIKAISRTKVFRYYSPSFGERNQDINSELRSISNLRKKKENQLPSYEEFYYFNVVIMTLVSSIRFVQADIKSNHFDYIFIDECAASIEPECLIPLTGFALNSDSKIFSQIVLLGDHKQLGPIVNSKFALDLCLGVSLMERMMHMDQYSRKDPKYVTQLLDNYRSHEAILQFSNQQFYDGELRAKADPREANFALNWNYLPNKQFPILLHSVMKHCEKEKDGFSWFNEAEIGFVKQYVNELLRNGINGISRMKQSDIGIVTPYKAQQVKLSAIFRNNPEIEIGTAEYFQGREKNVIVISTVRSGVSIGFLKDERRLNVALTRAKCLMIVVCNPISLSKDQMWYAFVKYCKENNACAGEFFQFGSQRDLQYREDQARKNQQRLAEEATDRYHKEITAVNARQMLFAQEREAQIRANIAIDRARVIADNLARDQRGGNDPRIRLENYNQQGAGNNADRGCCIIM